MTRREGDIDRRTVLKGIGASGAVGLTGLSGCTSSSSGGSKSQKLKIGHISPYSGVFGWVGGKEMEGAKLAKQDIESELDLEIELVTADTETDPGVGLKQFKTLVNREGIDMAFGPTSSSVALKVQSWASSNGVPIMPTAASTALTGSECAKNSFRPLTNMAQLSNSVGKHMADYADSWYILYSDYSAGRTAFQSIKQALEDNGTEIKGSQAAPFPSNDYTGYLNNAKSSGADGLALAVFGPDKRRAINQYMNKEMYEEMKLSGPYMDESQAWSLGKEPVSKMGLWAVPWTPSNPTEASQAFAKRVTEETDQDPSSRHYFGYTALDQLARAAHRAGSVDPEKIRTELEGHEVKNSIKGKGVYFRECDHQLVQPVSVIKPKSVDEMEDSPRKDWFEHLQTFDGDEISRSCSESNCTFE